MPSHRDYRVSDQNKGKGKAPMRHGRDEDSEDDDHHGSNDPRSKRTKDIFKVAGGYSVTGLGNAVAGMSISRDRTQQDSSQHPQVLSGAPPQPPPPPSGGPPGGPLGGSGDGFGRKPPAFYHKPGRVISVIWPEPTGRGEGSILPDGSKYSGSRITSKYQYGEYGGRIFRKLRHFIIIKAREDHCLALGIWTHGGRGVAHRKYKHQYGIVWTSDRTHKTAPRPQPDERPRQGERGMQPIAIRVLPDRNTDALDQMSRINYAKLYTIEYDIDVRPFGIVHEDSREPLRAQFSDVFQSSRDAESGRSLDRGNADDDDDDDDDEDDEDIRTWVQRQLAKASKLRPDMSKEDKAKLARALMQKRKDRQSSRRDYDSEDDA